MLFLLCENCQGKGVLNYSELAGLFSNLFQQAGVDTSTYKDEDVVCEFCEGTGYHRKYYQTSASQQRVAVLRMLDLVYPEHKHRVRTQRLLELFQIVPLIEEEPPLTAAAQKLKEQKDTEK